MTRYLIVAALIGTLLVGQTFCCCSVQFGSQSDHQACSESLQSCCCGNEAETSDKTPPPCPCKQKRQLAEVGSQVVVDLAVDVKGFCHVLSAVVVDDVRESVLLLNQRAAQEQVRCLLPRTDRVALAQLLLC